MSDALIQRLRSSLANFLRIARISLPGSDAGDFPIQQLRYLGKTAEAPVSFSYGHHANLPADTIVAFFQSPDGSRIAFPTSSPKRVRLPDAGEVAWFHPETGSRIVFKASGDIEVDLEGASRNLVVRGTNAVVALDADATINCVNAKVSASTKIDLDTPTLEALAALVAKIGAGSLKKLVNEEFKANFDGHTHFFYGDAPTVLAGKNTSGPEDGAPDSATRGSASPIATAEMTTHLTAS